MWRRVPRPRVLVYSLVLVAVAAAFVASLALRAPFKADIVRDRGTLARLVAGGRIENVYRVQLMNGTEQTQRFRIAVEGLRAQRSPTVPTSRSRRPRRAGCRSRCRCRRGTRAGARPGRASDALSLQPARAAAAGRPAGDAGRWPSAARSPPSSFRVERRRHVHAIAPLACIDPRPRRRPLPWWRFPHGLVRPGRAGAGRRRRLRDDGDRLSPCRRRRGRGAGAAAPRRSPARPRRRLQARNHAATPPPCRRAMKRRALHHPLAGVPRGRRPGRADLRGRRPGRPALVRRRR